MASSDNLRVLTEGLTITIDDTAAVRVAKTCQEILTLQSNINLSEFKDVIEKCILNAGWWLTFKNRIHYNLNLHRNPPMTALEEIGLLEFIGLCSLYGTSPQFMCENPRFFRATMLSQARFFHIVRSFDAPNTPGVANWECASQNAKYFHSALKEFSSMTSTLALTADTSIIVDDDKMPYRSAGMAQVMGLKRPYHRDAAPGPVLHIGASVNTGLILSAVPQVDNNSDNMFLAVARRALSGM